MKSRGSSRVSVKRTFCASLSELSSDAVGNSLCFSFASPEGDHVVLLNIFRQYQSTKQKKVWCHENFLHYRNLQYSSEVRQQLAALAERANLESASCGTNTEQLRKALLEGLHENLAEQQRDGTYMTVSKRLDTRYIIISALLYFPSACFAPGVVSAAVRFMQPSYRDVRAIYEI